MIHPPDSLKPGTLIRQSQEYECPLSASFMGPRNSKQVNEIRPNDVVIVVAHIVSGFMYSHILVLSLTTGALGWTDFKANNWSLL